jgi:starch synthase
VRATGGLEDSVEEFDQNTHKGTGFKFKSNDVAEVMAVIKRVMRIFSNQALWRKIQKNGMAMDFSWEKTVLKYLDLYNKILVEDTHHG